MPQLDLYIWSLTVTSVFILFTLFYLIISYIFLFDLACIIFLKYTYMIYDKVFLTTQLEFFGKFFLDFFNDNRMQILDLWYVTLNKLVAIIMLLDTITTRITYLLLVDNSYSVVTILLNFINEHIIRLNLLNSIY